MTLTDRAPEGGPRLRDGKRVVDRIIERHTETPHEPRSNGRPCACDFCVLAEEVLRLRRLLGKGDAT